MQQDGIQAFLRSDLERLTSSYAGLLHLGNTELPQALHAALDAANIPHTLYLGGVSFIHKNLWLPYHMWVEIDLDGQTFTLDYRLRYLLQLYAIPCSKNYLDTQIPNGVFLPQEYPEVMYAGAPLDVPTIPVAQYEAMLTPIPHVPAFLRLKKVMTFAYDYEKSLELAETIEVYPRECWNNARRALKKHHKDILAGAYYVEGFIVGPAYQQPQAHGWIENIEGIVIDVTQAVKGHWEIDYFPGVRYSWEEMQTYPGTLPRTAPDNNVYQAAAAAAQEEINQHGL
jgi:hypothetical protein